MIQPSPTRWYIAAYRERFSVIDQGRILRRRPEPGSGETISKKKSKKAGKERTNGALGRRAQTIGDVKVRDYDAHVLICKGGDCKKRGSKDIRKALKDELRERGIARNVRVDSVDCLGLCKHGPNIIVYPTRTWYIGLRKEDVPEIVERNVESSEPVERLAAGFRPKKK
jgi:(2Fe-2S) ferredoxin